MIRENKSKIAKGGLGELWGPIKTIFHLYNLALSWYCLKSVQIRGCFWFIFFCIRSEITPYLDTFHAVFQNLNASKITVSIIFFKKMWSDFKLHNLPELFQVQFRVEGPEWYLWLRWMHSNIPFQIKMTL